MVPEWAKAELRRQIGVLKAGLNICMANRNVLVPKRVPESCTNVVLMLPSFLSYEIIFDALRRRMEQMGERRPQVDCRIRLKSVVDESYAGPFTEPYAVFFDGTIHEPNRGIRPSMVLSQKKTHHGLTLRQRLMWNLYELHRDAKPDDDGHATMCFGSSLESQSKGALVPQMMIPVVQTFGGCIFVDAICPGETKVNTCVSGRIAYWPSNGHFTFFVNEHLACA